MAMNENATHISTNRFGAGHRLLGCAGSLVVLVLLMVSTGCEPAALTIDSADAMPLPAGEGSADFIGRVGESKTVTENDAFHGLLLLADGKDSCENFQQRVETLVKRGMVDSTWTFGANTPLTREKLAYMMYQVGKVDGGVVLALTGPSRRYCLREMQYQGLMGPGSGYVDVTGMEYVAVLGRIDAYLQSGTNTDVNGPSLDSPQAGDDS